MAVCCYCCVLLFYVGCAKHGPLIGQRRLAGAKAAEVLPLKVSASYSDYRSSVAYPHGLFIEQGYDVIHSHLSRVTSRYLIERSLGTVSLP